MTALVQSHSSQKALPFALAVLVPLASFAAFGLLAYASIALTRGEGRIAAIWLPNAIMTAVLLRFYVKREWLVLLAAASGNLAANLASGDALGLALPLTVANSVEIAIAVNLTRRWCGPRPNPSDIADLRSLVVAAALCAPLASGLIASIALSDSPAGFLPHAAGWFSSDALGMLIIAPSVVIAVDAWRSRRWPTRREAAEWLILTGGGTGLTFYVFYQTSYPLLFLVPPVVIIHAFRLGSLGTAFSTIKVAVIALVFTEMGYGPINLVEYPLRTQLMVLELFIASAIAVGLPVAAILATRSRLIEELAAQKNRLARLAEERTVAVRRAEEAAAAKTRFLANMSHEIRTPMNGVLGFADLLQRRNLDGEAARHAELIAQSARSMMALLNDILDISKIDAGQVSLNPEAVDPAALARECLDLHSAGADRNHLALALRCDGNVPEMIETDALRLRQIIGNLLGNAIKFTERGEVSLRLLREGDKLAFAVEDTGIGIDPARIDQVFDPFVQADEETTRRFGGTGLGLSISRQLTELLGGTLMVDSMPGIGTCFTLRIPCKVAASARRQPEQDARPEFPAPPARGRVLLAEDHDINRMLVTTMLEDMGQDVAVAHDGLDAVDCVMRSLAEGRPYDLVLMDIQMPGCDGYAATRAIRAEGVGAQQLPIVALTANAYPEDVAMALDAGMQAHLAKPLVLEDLAAVLARWLPVRIVEEYGTAAPHPRRAPSPAIAERWQQRRREAIDAVSYAVQAEALAETDAQELARTMHKLAGTAGMFGEEELGRRAAALERALRADVAGEVRRRLAEELLQAA